MVVTVNERLKDLRSETKLKLEEFSSLLGLSKSTISDYEQDGNTVPFDYIIKVAKVCNVSTDYIAGLSETRNPTDIDVKKLHLSDKAIEKLCNPSFNPNVLSEMIETDEFSPFMRDMEIYINGYVEEGLGYYNIAMNSNRKKLEYQTNNDANSIISRELDLIRVSQDDYFTTLFGKDIIPIANRLKEKHKESSSTSNFKIEDEDISDLFVGFLDENGNIKKDKGTLAKGILVLIKKLMIRSNFSEIKANAFMDRIQPILSFLIHESPTIETNSRKRRNSKKSSEE